MDKRTVPCPLPYPRLYKDLPHHHWEAALELQSLFLSALSPSAMHEHLKTSVG